jgi:hypothetical protein
MIGCFSLVTKGMIGLSVSTLLKSHFLQKASCGLIAWPFLSIFFNIVDENAVFFNGIVVPFKTGTVKVSEKI